jgi:hypothetical protein
LGLCTNLSDHILLRSKIAISVKPPFRHLFSLQTRRLDINNLPSLSMRVKLTSEISLPLIEMDVSQLSDINSRREYFRDIPFQTSSEVLGKPNRNHQD